MTGIRVLPLIRQRNPPPACRPLRSPGQRDSSVSSRSTSPCPGSLLGPSCGGRLRVIAGGRRRTSPTPTPFGRSCTTSSSVVLPRQNLATVRPCVPSLTRPASTTPPNPDEIRPGALASRAPRLLDRPCPLCAIPLALRARSAVTSSTSPDPTTFRRSQGRRDTGPQTQNDRLSSLSAR